MRSSSPQRTPQEELGAGEVSEREESEHAPVVKGISPPRDDADEVSEPLEAYGDESDPNFLKISP